jgi:hypothetical protein
MKKRMGLWAFAGFGVAVCWAFLAAAFGPRVNFGDWTLLRWTLPIAWIGRRIAMTYYEAIVLNSVTYALFGLATEPLWRRYRPQHPS